MRKMWFSLVLVLLVFAACGPQPTSEPPAAQPIESLPSPVAEQPTEPLPSPTGPVPTDTPLPPPATQPSDTATPVEEQPTDTPPPPTSPVPTKVATAAEFPGESLPTDRGELFSASGACAVCHSQMVDETGSDVSTDTFWRGSMMANSARDPYWQASVRGEVLSNPALQEVIEDKCAVCHMGMARFTATTGGGAGQILDTGFADPEHELYSLAIDGVSCALCHQIGEEGLGEAESFSGGFVLDPELPIGEREAFGPHPVEEDLVQIMQASSGFVPVESLHVDQPEFCATCHTLYTPYVDAAGEVGGVFPEQMAYDEWSASSFGGGITCQGCHMPSAKGGVQLSITGGPLRSPFHQHIFVGGNAYMLELLRTLGPEMAVTASSAQFEGKQAQVVEQLQKRTASINLEDVQLEDSTLVMDVALASMVGHKFPTGFPSRRVWIHLVVEDAGGQVVFESGAVNSDGSIVGNDNDSDPSAYEPHYLTIENPDQVQIYESIMADTEGKVTTTLLRGAGYLKDNRLPPAGFDKGEVDDDIAVRGAAFEDGDFVGGSDRIQYIIDVGDAQGPFTVTSELLYQSIGYRWAENVRSYDGPEPTRFGGYYDQVPNLPVVVASATTEVGD